METLLIHEDLLGNTGGSGSSTGTFFADVCAMLKNEGVSYLIEIGLKWSQLIANIFLPS